MPPKPEHTVTGLDSNTAITIDYSTCMGCGMCARICSDSQMIGAIKPGAPKQPPMPIPRDGDMSKNTDTTRALLVDTACVGCGQCVQACAFNALRPTSRVEEIWAAKKAGKKLIAVLAPSTRVGISEAMGMEPGTSAEGQLICGLRELGFDYVFDNQWGADACTIEDTKEVIHMREKKCGPAFTSCCPAWVNLVELKYPELIPRVSTARSPNGMICATIKRHWIKDVNLSVNDIFVVGFMPCTAKKMEAARHELSQNDIPDCDVSVTTREFAEMLKAKGIEFSAEKEVEARKSEAGHFDAPFNKFSGSAYIFGKTAGVTESVIRYICALKNVPCDMSKAKAETLYTAKDNIQTVKVLEIEIAGEVWRAAVAHGGAAVDECVKRILDGSLKVDVVEVMMCPLGCQNGGGQPRQMKKALIPKRAEALEAHDKASAFADCESNVDMHAYIDKHMPTEHDIHNVFHTHYTERK